MLEEDAVGPARGARYEWREAELAAGLLQRRALPELKHAQLGRRRNVRAALDGRPLEAEELEHRVAHVGNGGEDAAGQHEQRDQREGERAAKAGGRKQAPAANGAGAGLAQARPHAAGQIRRLRPVELAAELREALLEVAHASASPSSSRRRSSARESRDLTVPRGQSSAAAVSSSLSSRR